MPDEKAKEKMAVGLLIAAMFIVVFNGVQIAQIGNVTGQAIIADSPSPTTQQASYNSILPAGVPQVYGTELGVSFSDVTPEDEQKTEATIARLAVLDQQIELSGAQLERYKEIAGQMSCEYCCGAPSIIFADGKAACGCAHSYVMRGVAKYLITEHGDGFTDEEILEELGKWKTLFFPTQSTEKASVLEEKGIELSYTNIASNKYRGIEQGAGSGMVGGC